MKSNEAVFLNPNNKDVSASLHTVVEKLGCSKLDENELDDSVFEIDDEELSDEEEIYTLKNPEIRSFARDKT